MENNHNNIPDQSLPPKLRYTRAAKLESAKNSKASTSVTDSSTRTFSSKMNDKIKMGAPKMRKKKDSKSGFSKASASSSSGVSENGLSSKCKEVTIDSTDVEWTSNVPVCPTYRPSKEEFEDPFTFLQKIVPEASKFGICKIVSPLSPSLPAATVLKKEKGNFKFLAEQQILRPRFKAKTYFTDKNYTVQDFEMMASQIFARKYGVAGCLPASFIEKDFWKQMAQTKCTQVDYGSEIEGTAFSSDPYDQLGSSKWSFKRFSCLPQSISRLLEKSIPGITEPLLYFGMLFSFSYWRIEEMHLYSISYHHSGAPKTWYGVPGDAALKFERTAMDEFYADEDLSKYEAYDMLHFNTTMFSPNILLQHGVPVYKTVQLPGEFVITFPSAYHVGFSHGFNIGEAMNFGTYDWFRFGAEAIERRALYARKPNVPYQQLLCKEAMVLSKNDEAMIKPASIRDVKVFFACLIRLHHFVCEKIRTTGECIVPNFGDSIPCGICGRECYLAYVTCNCEHEPVCIFHDIYQTSCPCKVKRRLSVRADIVEMEKAAKKFEEEEGILEEVEAQLEKCVTLGCIPSREQHMDLDRLIGVEDECRLANPRIAKKRRTNNW